MRSAPPLVETGRDLEGAGEMDGEWRGDVNEEELKGVLQHFIYDNLNPPIWIRPLNNYRQLNATPNCE